MVTPAIGAKPTALDAGAGLTATGGGSANSLRAERAGQYLTGVGLAPSYTLAGTGGNGVGTFSASVSVPAPAAVLLSLPATPTVPIASQAYPGIGNSSSPIQFSASGLDLGFAAAMIWDSTGVGTGFTFQ